MAKKTKKLPRGNLKVVTNVRPGKYGRTGPPSRDRLVFGSASGYTMPVLSNVKPEYKYNVRPGFERAALPEQGPPGTGWKYDPSYRGYPGWVGPLQ